VAEPEDGGGVDQVVEPAVGLPGLGEDLGDEGLVGDVALQVEGIARVLARRLAEFRGRVL
jgi:hypothetical protein